MRVGGALGMMLVVVEQAALVRDGLVSLLAGAGRVAGAESVAAAAALCSHEPEGVLLLDLGLLGDGAAGIGAARAAMPGMRIVALAARESRDGILQCLAAGAHGYVAKTAGAGELLRAVRAVASGRVHVPASLAAAPAGDAAAAVASVAQLTGRQRDVLRLLAEGRSTKDIARTLDLAVSTIKVHLAGVYRAVGARNRVEALCRAGLVPRDALAS